MLKRRGSPSKIKEMKDRGILSFFRRSETPMPPIEPHPGAVNEERSRLLFSTAADVRKFEIDLFWKRSVFFWGFISAAFVGYATLIKSQTPTLALPLACFGMVCSVAWTLVNRGSKYWQEAWERKVERVEKEATNSTPFATEEPLDKSKGPWLRARRMSVSKLTIALSDFTSAIWAMLVLRTAAVSWAAFHPEFETEGKCTRWLWSGLKWANANQGILLPLGSIIFVLLMLWQGRTTPRSENEN
jgi:hypothetical protein